MLKQKFIRTALFLLGVFAFSNIFGQISPEIQLAARGVMSVNLNVSPEETTSAVNDFSDSGLLFGFRQKLFNKFRGQFVIGMQFPDANSNLGQIFFHQTFIQLDDRTNIIKLGRSRVASSLIEFPTLRDDDAIYFTDVLNPFSSGANTEDNQFGNVLEFTHIFAQRYRLQVHGEHFTETPKPPETIETDFNLNSIGLSFMYRVPASQLWERPVIQQIGIGVNNFLTDRPDYTNEFDQMLTNVTFSTIINVLRDPVYFLDMRGQVIYNKGFDEITSVTDNYSMTRSASVSAFASVRYLLRKMERPTLQISVSAGYKNFFNTVNSTNQLKLIFNTFYRLGANFDIGFQIQYNKNNGDLKTLLGSDVTRFQVAIVYSIEQLWNSQFDDRESLLNLEHGYIP
ncbi:hypothetical protein MNBD_IGNAVI01-343 [hydrothermal vent metagenome]|uniref:Uncharacterized protein n=1 Tax=hydrothermal vent metagenome TaxID=652676 RepID=A0A3B1CYK9_9ZZZZ